MSQNEKINVRTALRVFQKILDNGEKTPSDYQLNGLKATSDFDGYTVTLFNDYVTLNIFFHNKFSLEYSSQKERDVFLEKLEQIDRQWA